MPRWAWAARGAPSNRSQASQVCTQGRLGRVPMQCSGAKRSVLVILSAYLRARPSPEHESTHQRPVERGRHGIFQPPFNGAGAPPLSSSFVTSLLRTLLVVLLALPSIALPPGVTLEWCLCRSPACGCTDLDERADAFLKSEDTCCTDHSASGTTEVAGECCCSSDVPADPQDDRSEGGSLESSSCPCCQSVDIGYFEPGLEPAEPLPQIAPPIALARPAASPARALRSEGRFVANRAPPGVVRPAGLLPGTLPLLC